MDPSGGDGSWEEIWTLHMRLRAGKKGKKIDTDQHTNMGKRDRLLGESYHCCGRPWLGHLTRVSIHLLQRYYAAILVSTCRYFFSYSGHFCVLVSFGRKILSNWGEDVYVYKRDSCLERIGKRFLPSRIVHFFRLADSFGYKWKGGQYELGPSGGCEWMKGRPPLFPIIDWVVIFKLHTAVALSERGVRIAPRRWTQSSARCKTHLPDKKRREREMDETAIHLYRAVIIHVWTSEKDC